MLPRFAFFAFALSTVIACGAPTIDRVGGDDDPSDGSIHEPEPDDNTIDGGENRPSPTEEMGNAKLAAFVGGASIAVRWSTIGEGSVGVDHYTVYRDGREIGTVTPGFHADFPEKNGKGFVDKNIQAGATYEYRVDAVRSGGAPARVGPAIKVTAPSELAPPPAITMDTSATPDLAAHAAQAKAFLDIWWPKVAVALALPDYEPVPAFTIKYDPTYDGVAYAAWHEARIAVNPKWTREHPEDFGLYIHEATHILHAAQNGPGWIAEGIADYTREYMVHDRDPKPIEGDQHYTQGYSQACYFLNWIGETRSVPFMRALTIAMHKGQYSPQLFVTYGGKSTGQLWEEMTGKKDRGGPLRWTDMANKCVTELNGRPAVGTCNGSDEQAWEWGPENDGTIWIRSRAGGCLDVQSSSTQMGAAVQTYGCNHTGAQKWKQQANGTLVNPNSGFCLDNPNGSTVDGTTLRIWDCNGSAAQRFTLPTN